MEESIKELIKNYINKIKTREDLDAAKRKYCKKYKLKSITNANLLKAYNELISKKEIKADLGLEKILRKKSIRTMSGVAPVAVLTKPYECPGNCAYCPRESEDVPVSYLSNEPAVMRAIRCDYNPYTQTVLRLKALESNGHNPNKIEIIVIGGTWSYLPKKYKYFYILNCFKAANDFNRLKKKIINSSERNIENNFKFFEYDFKQAFSENTSFKTLEKELLKEQKRNEKAKYKIIGLTLETRPDYINEEEIIEMRKLGCTRVEIGVQAIDDKILNISNRGHGVKETIKATSLLRKYGFKVTYHLMPGLPGATAKKDFEMFKEVFSSEDFQPDQIKFYPTVVTKGSLLYDWYKEGKYKPYSDKVLQDLIIKCKEKVPRYVRIIRLIRDIPGESIVAGNKITNLRQIMKDKGAKCECIRCREAHDKKIDKYQINIEKYRAANGDEYFISVDSLDGKILFGFCRLRIDKNGPISQAMIRELHVYGELIPVGNKLKKVQHSGIGKKLIKKAEEIAKSEKANSIAIISGVGVRGYYRKFSYKLKNTYMFKVLTKKGR
ncbi:MAG: tRNA uridine(34) 5-carboxymethylaminomethyl modification radical SAM/GNAT enzyme Elp3 [Patescibacteria group bacterium]|jgi:elongator complex protein 3|nr:tRNA uridine(34) 5-carboxymethylaminomethyl modification radical SAM/GNAT enzyme Elp3 [Patescibacteria group bacterium]